MLIKLEWLGYRTVRKLWQYVKPFSSDLLLVCVSWIPERHRHTDGRTDRIAMSISRVSVLIIIIIISGFGIYGAAVVPDSGVLALDLEGVHDVKLHHPSSSVATSNQWCWSGVRGNINKLLLIVVMCCILLLHILWSGLQVSQIGFCLTGSISLWFR